MNTLFRLCLIVMLAVLASTASAVEKVTYYHNDALGSPIAATDAQGSLLWEEAYEPYGKRLLKEDGGKEEVWFTGKQEESAFDVSYFGARWYDPSIGRFLAIDPAGVSSSNIHSFSRYTYANNNPYRYVDPDGRDSYLVSRKLNMPINGNHNFIVSNANSLGDPKATVSSFGDVGNDTMGQVFKNTKGFSEGTFDTDTKAWEGLKNGNQSVTYRKINAKDSAVNDLVKRVDEGLEYSAIPELQGGVNSNTAAGAVAKKADGGSSSVNNGSRQPGSSVTNRIKFNRKQAKP